MKDVSLRLIVFFTSIIFLGTLLQMGCGNTIVCKVDKDCEANQVCSDSKCVAKQKETTSDTEKTKVEKETEKEKVVVQEGTKDAGPVSDEPPKEVAPEKSTVCPPGCATCKGTQTSKKLGLGGLCQEPKKGAECNAQTKCKDNGLCLKPNKFSKKTFCYKACKTNSDCGKGLSCLSVDGKKVCTQPEPCDSSKGLRCIQNGINNAGYCYKSCEKDQDCGKDAGQKCLDSFCGVQNKAMDICNYSQQAFCQQGLICMVSDSKRTAGTCYKRCTQDTECSALNGLVCRIMQTGSKDKFCLPKLLPGPLCMGKKCSPSSTATNCMEGLICLDGVCSKTCKTATAKQDCDMKSGEKCEFVSFSSPRLCLLPPTVTEAGKPCSGTERCDSTKGLQCVAISQTSSVCMKKCDANKNEKDGTNAECGSKKYLCRQPQSTTTALCFEKADLWGNCYGGKACPANSMCVGFGGVEAYCLSECDKSKNKSEDDKTNPDCDGGKGTCIGLSSGDKGACLPYRELKLEKKQVCGMNGNLKAPDCKKGLRCFSGICMVDCDPCTANLSATGEWVHKNCENGTKSCTPLVYSDGRSAGGICQIKGNPVLGDGDYCGGKDQSGKDCKEGYHCVRFSNVEGAQAICSKDCDPSGKGTECASGSCGSLTNGDGICRPTPKRRGKLGDECLGDVGMDGYHDCLEKDTKGNLLVCARPPYPGAKRSCQIRCNPVDGVVDNAQCKKMGLTNHLCLPADDKEPTKGACLEQCHFVDKLRCKTSKCTLGQCQSTGFGRKGQCTTQEKEDECKKLGGTCNKDKTCIINICS